MNTLALILVTAMVTVALMALIYERLLHKLQVRLDQAQTDLEATADENSSLVHALTQHVESRFNDVTVFVAKPALAPIQSLIADEHEGQYELPFNVIPFQRRNATVG